MSSRQPPRLIAGDAGPDATLAALYQRTLSPRPPDGDRLQRVRARLALAETQLAQRPRGLPRAGLWVAGLLALGGAAGTTWIATRAPQDAPALRAPAPAVVAPGHLAAAERPAAMNPPAPAPPDALAKVPVARIAAPAARHRHAGPAPVPARRIARLAAPAAPAARSPVRAATDDELTARGDLGSEPGPGDVRSPLGDESRRLGLVYAHLRQRRNPDAALAEIAAYLRLYPDGVLLNEARLAEIDALLMKGQADGALAALSRVQLGNRPRQLELRLIRGELRARTDCPAAVVDFGAVLATQASPALQERALRGRAACNLRQGDRAAARNDLTDYLRRFPDSQHAARARAQLEATAIP